MAMLPVLGTYNQNLIALSLFALNRYLLPPAESPSSTLLAVRHVCCQFLNSNGLIWHGQITCDHSSKIIKIWNLCHSTTLLVQTP